MAMQFIQDPNGPRGMGRVVDPESGLDRLVYDPSLAEEIEAGATPSTAPRNIQSVTPDQQLMIDNAAEAPTRQSKPVVEDPELTSSATATVPGIPGMPPPVTKQAAESWAAKQAPVIAPIVRASGAPMPPGPAPEGTVLSKAKIEMGTPGYTYDQAAEDERTNRNIDKMADLENRAAARDIILNEQQIELQKQKEDAERRQAEMAQKTQRYERELETVVKTEINQDRLEQNKGFFGSLLGLIGQTLGYLSTPDSGFGRLQAALDRRVQRDIDAQKEVKESQINMLTKKLGSAEQAENHYRAQVYATTANIMENRLNRLGVADQYADRIQALRDNALAYNEAAKAASFGKPGQATYEYERPKPTGPAAAPLNATEQQLKDLGITREQYTKGLSGKVLPGENSPTIAQAADTTKRIDSDLALLDSIAAANDGTLPTKGVINIPQFMVPKLAQLGYQPGMDAEQVTQILDGYINQQARSYGGAITESDRESAKKETGHSSDGMRFFLRRLRDKNNSGIRSALEQHFPGSGQKVFNLFLQGTSSNTGVAESSPVPFEKQNVPPAPVAATPEKPKVTPSGGRTLESITGIDEMDAQAKRTEEARKKRIQEEADRTARRTRLERFLQ